MKNILFFVLLLFFITSKAQTTIGQWRVHLPYFSGKLVDKNNNTVYCVTDDGFFSYDTQDNSITELSKFSGFSDIGISAIKSNEDLDITIIAYENSNIDILRGNDIINISDIKDKQIAGNKSINSILYVNDYAYLSCGFGIVKLDLSKNEIADTYYIGENGENINVWQVSYDGTNLYAATEKGIFKVNEQDPQILNFQKWEHCTILPEWNKEFKYIAKYNNKLYTLVNFNEDSTILYELDPDFSSFSAIAENIYNKQKIKASDNQLVLFTDTAIYFYNEQISKFEVRKNPYTYPRPQDILISDGTIYIADRNRSLIKLTGDLKSRYQPQGPLYTDIFDMDIYNREVWAVRGGRNVLDGKYLSGTAYSYLDYDWTNHVDYDTKDWTSVKINPNDPKQVFVGSTNYGIVEFYDGKIVNKYNLENLYAHTLQTIIDGKNYIRIGGLDFDKQGNLWITNYSVSKQISVLKSDGTWKAFDVKNAMDFDYCTDILVTKNNVKWIVLTRGEGLFAFDDNGTIDDETDDQVYKFKNKNSKGEILSNEIYSIVEDKDGVIWLGTSEGIVVYYNPENVFENSDYFYASQIIIEQNGEAKHLLATEYVNAIAVDGANRKWIGTETSGVFLVSADGTQELAHFTEENSPLLSNTITKIKIDQKTGEVYIATSRGLISYKGDAIATETYFSDVYAYPNPVREDYEGDIVITGLIENTDVKITDIAGNFVFETMALGGQAVWDGKTLDGQKVKTGVYLVFLSNDDGSQTAVTKILIIN